MSGVKGQTLWKRQQGSRNSNKQEERKPWRKRAQKTKASYVSSRLVYFTPTGMLLIALPREWRPCGPTPGGPNNLWRQSLKGSFEDQSGGWWWWVSRGCLSWDPRDGAVQMRLSQLAAPSSPLLPSGLQESASSSGAVTFFPFFLATRTLSPLLWLIQTHVQPPPPDLSLSGNLSIFRLESRWNVASPSQVGWFAPRSVTAPEWNCRNLPSSVVKVMLMSSHKSHGTLNASLVLKIFFFPLSICFDSVFICQPCVRVCIFSCQSIVASNEANLLEKQEEERDERGHSK